MPDPVPSDASPLSSWVGWLSLIDKAQHWNGRLASRKSKDSTSPLSPAQLITGRMGLAASACTSVKSCSGTSVHHA
eukprot:356549-Amphidinium_carterae.1